MPWFVWYAYPMVSVRRLAVSPDGDLLFYKRPECRPSKKVSKKR
jgi:hypothetical protein